jgi:hypothetical protein
MDSAGDEWEEMGSVSGSLSLSYVYLAVSETLATGGSGREPEGWLSTRRKVVDNTGYRDGQRLDRFKLCQTEPCLAMEQLPQYY